MLLNTSHLPVHALTVQALFPDESGSGYSVTATGATHVLPPGDLWSMKV